MRLPLVDDVAGVDAAVLGIPFDTATSFRAGARFGPEAVRSASALLRPYHRVHGVEVFDHLSAVDFGDLPVVPGNTEQTYANIVDGLRPLVDAGVVSFVIGGDHSITLPHLRALAARHGPLALVHIDAHSDTWDSYWGEKYFHGTTFLRAVEEGLVSPSHSIQAGMRGPLYGEADVQQPQELGFRVIYAEDLRQIAPADFGAEVLERVDECKAFLSFDIDFLDPAYAPGTGTPEVAGFTSAEAVQLLRSLAGIELVGFDCVEVSPPYDSPGQPTALAAANVVWEALALLAVGRAKSPRVLTSNTGEDPTLPTPGSRASRHAPAHADADGLPS